MNNLDVRSRIENYFSTTHEKAFSSADVENFEVKLFIENNLKKFWGIAGCDRIDGLFVQISFYHMVRMPDQIEETIDHELAHLLTFILHGKVKSHGPEWKGVMKRYFGRDGKSEKFFDEKALPVWKKPVG